MIDISDATEETERIDVLLVDGAVIIDNDYTTGDITLDGIVTNADVIALARYLVNLVEFNAEQLIVADVDADGEIDNADLIKLARSIIA